jgi:hypothetical protein
MSTDNRTIINDCDANTGWSGSDSASVVSLAGLFFEGAASLSTQYSNVQEDMSTTEDSVGATTFSLDWSDSTLYMLIKDNLMADFATLGVQFIIGDVTPDTIGYRVGGIDARGVPLGLGFATYRLDVSVIVAAPGTDAVDFQTIAGGEGTLDQTACTHIGYGGEHASKAQGAIDNAFMDCFRYIANGSFALTVNGGTIGTPETMADVFGDDVVGGWGMVANPLGAQYVFAAPTEWGAPPAATADSYFTATGEQWYWVGDNAGGHALGDDNFPFRLAGNSTGTNSWVITGVVIVNTGTRAQFDMSDAEMDIVEVDGASLIGVGAIELPSSGGTSRFTLSTIFSDCDQVTNNGADMDGSSVLLSNVIADTGALLYNEAADPDGTLDNLTLSSGATAHHAIDFGTAVDSSLVSITLRGIAFNGFGAVDDADASTVRFLAGSGSLTLNLIDCTVDGISPVASGGGQNFSVDDAAGMTVTVVVAPVTLQITVSDADTLLPIENVQTSIHLADSPFTELMNEDTTASGIASESYAGSTPIDIVWRTRKSDDLDSPRYFAQSGLGEITTAGFTLSVSLEENTILP